MELPLDLQLYILNFIPINEMKNVKLACKNFHSFCTELSRNKVSPAIFPEHLEQESQYDHAKFFLNTTLEFDSVKIILENYKSFKHNKLMDILAVHGERIKKLRLVRLYETKLLAWQSRFTEMLNALPNLEEIHSDYFFNTKDMFDDEETPLNLPKLHTAIELPTIIASKLYLMPNSSLVTLKLADGEVPNLSLIFKKHASTLKNLEIARNFPELASAIFKPLKLQTLNINCNSYPHEARLTNIIKSQPYLRELSFGEIYVIGNFFALSEMFSTVCNLKWLKKLEMGVSADMELEDISLIGKLSRLVEIKIEFESLSHAEAFCKIYMPSIKYLEIGIEIPGKLLKNISKNFPNTKEFKGEFCEPVWLNSILQALPNLQNLVLFKANQYGFLDDGIIYPKMKRFEIWCDDEDPFELTVDFIKAMPNLQDIKVNAMVYDENVLEALLASKIESIRIGISSSTLSSQGEFMKLKSKLWKKFGKQCNIWKN